MLWFKIMKILICKIEKNHLELKLKLICYIEFYVFSLISKGLVSSFIKTLSFHAFIIFII